MNDTTHTAICLVEEVAILERDGEPRARDIDIAERLGFSRPRKIRELIERNKGEIEAFGTCPTAGRVLRGNNVTEYWLNEEQALLVATLSEAPNAPAVRSMLIHTFVAWRRGHLVPMIDKGAIGRQVAAIVEDKLKAFSAILLPMAVSSYMAEHNISVTDGVTAGEVCALAKVADRYPRGLAGRVSRRLTVFCARNGETPRVSRLGRVRAQLFPTHLVRDWLDIEGRALIRRWIDERKGQGSLKLVQL